MPRTKLFTFAMGVKQIKFDPKVTIKGDITSRVTFLRYRDQMIFPPVKPIPSEILVINSGKTFVFGLSHDVMAELYKNFIVNLDLYQINPDKKLSEAKLDLTKIYCQLFDDPCHNVTKSQLNATVEFKDKGGKKMACMDLTARLIPSGPNVLNEFNLDNNVDNQYSCVPNDCFGCPIVPDLKIPKKQHDDDGEWDIVCAELPGGQKIAVKYKRSYYEFKSAAVDEPCEPTDDVKISKNEEKLNNHLIELMEGMHKLVTDNNIAH